MKAFCVHCKTARDMENPKLITMKNGRKAYIGRCPVCKIKMHRMGG